MKKLLFILPIALLTLTACGSKSTPVSSTPYVPEQEEKSGIDILKEQCDAKSLQAIRSIEEENKMVKPMFKSANAETVSITFKLPKAEEIDYEERIISVEEGRIVESAEELVVEVAKGTTWKNIIKPYYRRNDAVYSVLGFSKEFDAETNNGKKNLIHYEFHPIGEQEEPITFVKDTYYKKVESEYVLLEEQPEDWETNYFDYFIKEEKVHTRYQYIGDDAFLEDAEVYAIYDEPQTFTYSVIGERNFTGDIGDFTAHYGQRITCSVNCGVAEYINLSITPVGFANQKILEDYYNLVVTNSGANKIISFIMPCDDITFALGNANRVYEQTPDVFNTIALGNTKRYNMYDNYAYAYVWSSSYWTRNDFFGQYSTTRYTSCEFKVSFNGNFTVESSSCLCYNKENSSIAGRSGSGWIGGKNSGHTEWCETGGVAKNTMIQYCRDVINGQHRSNNDIQNNLDISYLGLWTSNPLQKYVDTVFYSEEQNKYYKLKLASIDGEQFTSSTDTAFYEPYSVTTDLLITKITTNYNCPSTTYLRYRPYNYYLEEAVV